MSIYTQIQRDKSTKIDDRALLSLIMSEICVDGKPMSDDRAILKLIQLKKNAQKNIELYNDRLDVMEGESNPSLLKAIESESAFIALIDWYLPDAASLDDILGAISELGLERTIKSMGPIMAHLKRSFAVVDGNLVRSALLIHI